MKKILVFSKGGRLRFVGHLDVMRAFQRALNRAGIQLAYSQGFNPHPLMSFASPLSLGYEGENEIVEIILEKEMTDEALFDALSAQLPEGLKLRSVRTGVGQKGNAMARLAAAEFELKSTHAYFTEQNIRSFFEQEELPVEKLGKVKGRKRTVTVDIKPLIYRWSYQDGSLFVIGAGGPSVNFNPEHLLASLASFSGLDKYPETSISRKRLLYEKEGAYYPLEQCEEL